MASDWDDFDLTFMQMAEPALGMQVGEQLLAVHPRKSCEGRDIPCCVHAPSDHHMRTWPLNWRADTRVMERLCHHGTGHPDPDHLAYVLSLTPEHDCPDEPLLTAPGPLWWAEEKCRYPHFEWQAVHSCDGCCTPPGPGTEPA
jgi:hypothetical protein